MPDYYTTLSRQMMQNVRDVGAMPFVLFQYYRTYETAPDGIRPSLERTARDLGLFNKKGNPSKSAVSNLKKILKDKNWIDEVDGRIIILEKPFRNSERFSEILNDDSEILNDDSEILNDDSEILNDDSEILNGTAVALKGSLNKEFTEEEKRGENNAPASDNFQNYAFLMNFDFYEIHAHFFKDTYSLTVKDKQIIKNRIIDKRAWIQALVFWYENSYLGRSIGKQCDVYDEFLIKSRVRKPNGHNQKYNETERQRREREAAERINFNGVANQLLENEGIIQVGCP